MNKLLLTGLLIPAVLFGQKTNDLIIALQRDMSSLQEQMKNLQKGQDDKLASIQALLQQAQDSSARVSASMAALQREIDTKLKDQQDKLVLPVATMGTKVDQLADEFHAVGTTVAELAKRIDSQDAKLKDISDAIRTLAAAAPAPALPAPVTAAPPNPCAGVSADSLWESARRDRNAGHIDMAKKEFEQYVTCFSDTANAPVALFEVAMMYFNDGQSDPAAYESAAKAFNDVVERFPENPKTSEALYYKAVSLFREGGDHRTESGTVFKDYLARYPTGSKVADAHRNLQAMGLERKPGSRK